MEKRLFIRKLVGVVLRLLARVEVHGLENVPAQGAGILAINHVALLDSPLVYIQIHRSDLTGLVADKHQHNPLLRWLVNGVGGIWINREEADFRALREALEVLKKGWLLGIAPEGTRSRTGALIQGKTGVAYLADKAGAPVIPVGVTGAEQIFSSLLRLRRPTLTARFGQPFRLPPLDRRDRAAGLERNTAEIMCRIAALLPPDYRGVYADHPRLRELLAEGTPASASTSVVEAVLAPAGAPEC